MSGIVVQNVDGRRVAHIRTSDRALFKRCRRLWAWRSHLKENRTVKEPAIQLWFGTGIHYALEDFYSAKRYKTLAHAWVAYVMACRKSGMRLPYEWEEARELGIEMCNYYEFEYLPEREYLETYVHEGVPQCEVHVEIPIPEEHWPEFVKDLDLFDDLIYSLQFDRVCVDSMGDLWIIDYKTAARFETYHLDTDEQVSAYLWAGTVVYGRPIRGMIYQQHLKNPPHDPLYLKSGGISTNVQQRTTFNRYQAAIKNLYGSVQRAPDGCKKMLDALALEENEHSTKYVRRDYVERNQRQIEAQGAKILLELEDMLNPNTPLYPNPQRQCSYCELNAACVAMDRGDTWEDFLDDMTVQRNREEEVTSWRQHLPAPSKVKL